MSGWFYTLGKMAGPPLRKTKWLVQSLMGSDAAAIQAEYEMGCDLARALTRQMRIDSDSNAAAWLAALGDQLAARVVNRRRRFCFRIVQAEETNAFALPGGFVFVTRPLLELCSWEPDQTAFVLGHEMGHVIRRHALDRLMSSSLVHAVGRAVPAPGPLRPVVVSLVGEILQKGYSREQELDADGLGVRLTRSAGFDPASAIRLLERLKQQASESAVSCAYFSCHPPFDLRIRNVERLLKTR